MENSRQQTGTVAKLTGSQKWIQKKKQSEIVKKTEKI